MNEVFIKLRSEQTVPSNVFVIVHILTLIFIFQLVGQFIARAVSDQILSKSYIEGYKGKVDCEYARYVISFLLFSVKSFDLLFCSCCWHKNLKTAVLEIRLGTSSDVTEHPKSRLKEPSKALQEKTCVFNCFFKKMIQYCT